uniref:Kinesin-like protein n=1 Tax=Spongospora subterranea TaxID=70186 RepID=A0A0H5RTZ3_9EUKA|eukprot:CRZ12204.1 hypothetical protein [Spongospora subterranea]
MTDGPSTAASQDSFNIPLSFNTPLQSITGGNYECGSQFGCRDSISNETYSNSEQYEPQRREDIFFSKLGTQSNSSDVQQLLNALQVAHENVAVCQEELRSSIREFSEYKLQAEASVQRLQLEIETLRACHITNEGQSRSGALSYVKLSIPIRFSDMRSQLSKLKESILVVREFFDISLRKLARRLQQQAQKSVETAFLNTARLTYDLGEARREKSLMETLYKKEMVLRRLLHDEVLRLKGSNRVISRIRPVADCERMSQLAPILHCDTHDSTSLTLTNPITGSQSQHEFDLVIGDHGSQESVFAPIRDLIVSALDGFPVSIFAYGAAGSGKTYTMSGTPANPGMTFLTMKSLFGLIDTRSTTHRYQVSLSIIELYNKLVFDLLSNPDRTVHCELSLDADEKGVVDVKGALEVEVNTWTAMEQGLWRGLRASISDRSSRSHCIVRVKIDGICQATGTKYQSRLNLVDLAGSENMDTAGLSGVRISGNKHINKSVISLGGIFRAMSSKRAHIPFRDNKLTYLLSDALSGEAKTVVIFCMSPCATQLSETLNSIQFATMLRSLRQPSEDEVRNEGSTPGNNI